MADGGGHAARRVDAAMTYISEEWFMQFTDLDRKDAVDRLYR